jgi:glyoxylate reductase
LAPHVGTSTTETRVEMVVVCARNIIAAISNQIPPNCLNPQAKARQSIL